MEYASVNEPSDAQSVPDAIAALDERTRKCFAQLADVLPTNTSMCGLQWVADGWGVSLEEAKSIVDVLVAGGFLECQKILYGEPYYSIPNNEMLSYAKSLIDPDNDESLSSE